MCVFRAVLKIFLIIIWCLLTGVAGIILHPGGWNAISRLAAATKLWSKVNSAIIGLKKYTYGNKPEVSGIIVSNHLSYLDILTTSSLFSIRFSPNTDIAKWPLAGKYLGLSRPIWVDRSSRQGSKKTLNEFIETLQHGIDLIVFPEGKISDCRQGLQKFKSTVFESAIKGKFPVIPILIHYHDYDVCWTELTLPQHIWRVLKMKKVKVDVHYLDSIYPEKGENRKSFAERIHKIMNKKYFELYLSN
ncbi:MAG: 1-acyl-sn-glycerol-3-phosphate acyltransferase [Victivallales bacterium]|nr:1-acyl-sn-glycerol-3-phosphate acyltransferase [Victivallales bacterium]MCF7888887.1 1-acyl-sn-glycerol-3-phosphate acyltransferase [Victivallales bacterium]